MRREGVCIKTDGSATMSCSKRTYETDSPAARQIPSVTVDEETLREDIEAPLNYLPCFREQKVFNLVAHLAFVAGLMGPSLLSLFHSLLDTLVALSGVPPKGVPPRLSNPLPIILPKPAPSNPTLSPVPMPVPSPSAAPSTTAT